MTLVSDDDPENEFRMAPIPEIGIEERRVIVELIARLANLKNEMVDRILRPAGVRPDVLSAAAQQKGRGEWEAYIEKADRRTLA